MYHYVRHKLLHLMSFKIILEVFLLITSSSMNLFGTQNSSTLHFDFYNKKETSLNEVIEFRDLSGGDYTIGYGYDKFSTSLIPLAIYDKSFKDPLDTDFWAILLLATIGINDLNLYSATKKISSRRSAKKILAKYLTNLFLNKKDTAQNGIYDKDFWKNKDIPYYDQKRPNPKQPPPDIIPLSWINIEAKHKNIKYLDKLNKIHEKIRSKLSTHKEYNRNKNEDFSLKHIINSKAYFKRQKNGNYKLIVDQFLEKKPILIIDLKGENTSFKKAANWAIQTNIAKVLTSLIPVYGVPQLITALMERMFNFIEVLYLIRNARALNLVVEALGKNSNSPFYKVLTHDQLLTAVKYLKRGNTLLSGIIYSLFTKKESIAYKYLNYIEQQKEKNLKYLKEHDYKTIVLGNSFYALGFKYDEHEILTSFKIFSLIKRKTFRKRPHDVVDFYYPKKDYYKRNILESILIASNFLYIPVPLLQTVVKILYKEILIREIHRYQMSESGFKSYLIYNKDEFINALHAQKISLDDANNYYKLAHEIIHKRTLNPLELDIQGENEHKKKVENWIKKRYKNYRPSGKKI